MIWLNYFHKITKIELLSRNRSVKKTCLKDLINFNPINQRTQTSLLSDNDQMKN